MLANQAYRTYTLAAQQRGYRVTVIFVALPTVENAIARVAARVWKGGHDVPDFDIRRRWPAAHANLAWFAKRADAIEVFDNSALGGPPKRVTWARDGKVMIGDPNALPEVTNVLAPLVSSPRT